tara:strand:- start:1981 stop:2136 length:156 start_codon:yes stop_codon:yes gene_type:complete
MYSVIRDGVEKGIHSLEHEDLENISEEELVRVISDRVRDEIYGWFSLGEER